MTDFLGIGVQFPFGFTVSGGVAVSDGTPPEHAHIHESIHQILSTRPGERFMLPEFGSRLPELVFQRLGLVVQIGFFIERGRAGFRVYGVEPKALQYDGVFYDELLMALEL